MTSSLKRLFEKVMSEELPDFGSLIWKKNEIEEYPEIEYSSESPISFSFEWIIFKRAYKLGRYGK